MQTKARIEYDSIGEVHVPADKYWGAQTQRSHDNFRIGTQKMPIEVIYALALIKKAAAIVNAELKLLSAEKKNVIVEVCDEILAGKLDDHFPLLVWQTGSGTQTNMNVNEVISNRAIEKLNGKLGSKQPIHPNDDVNKGQSTNDVFPSAMHIATSLLIRQKLLPNLEMLYQGFVQKTEEFKEIIKIGRTHLMDAVPLTLGQEFSGYATQIRQVIDFIKYTVDQLSAIALGGTAVGTGLNTHPQFAEKTSIIISELLGVNFYPAKNKFAALAAHDALVQVSAALRQVAVSFLKIGTDIALLASGPRCGLSELILPSNEPGSSIMPGKVNPTQCEALIMVATQVMGNDVAVTFAGSLGSFELNAFKPVIIYNLLKSIHLISDVSINFYSKCLVGIKPNMKKINEYVNNSLMLATALNTAIGYDKASQIVKKAYHDDITIKQAAMQLGFIDEKQFDKVVDPQKMVYPHGEDIVD